MEELTSGGALQADGDLTGISGRAYVDGSCTAPLVRGMARASCAIVQTDGEGTPSKILRVPVPRHLPQTAQAAEFLGLGLAVDKLVGDTIITGDCLNVVRAANGAGRDPLGHNKVYAGIVMAMFAQPDKKRWAGTVQWTKAHRVVTGREPPDVLRDIKGNAAADAAAKSAVALHPALGALAESQLAYYGQRIEHVVQATLTALQFFPRAPGNMPRAPKPATVEQARHYRRHLWVFKGGAWRCSVCCDWLNGKHLPRYRKHQRCNGKSRMDSVEDAAGLGHALYRAEADIPFMYCNGCGAWCHRRAHLLVGSCGPPEAYGLQALRRIRAGLHPLQRRGPLGTLLPRERIRTVARYSAEEARWIPLTMMDADAGVVPISSDGRPLVCDSGGGGGDRAPGDAHNRHGSDGVDVDDVGRAEADAGAMTLEPSISCGVDVADDGARRHEASMTEVTVGLMDTCLQEEVEEAALARAVATDDQVTGTTAGPGERRIQSQVCPRRGAKSIWQRSEGATTRAAVQRLMKDSRPPPAAEATERLNAVKRRVMERLHRAVTVERGVIGDAWPEAEEMGPNAALETYALCPRDGDSRCVESTVRGRGLSVHGPGEDADAVTVDLQTDSRRVRPRLEMVQSGEALGVMVMCKGAGAEGAFSCVDVACEGPGDPSLLRATDTATRPTSAAIVADTVAEEEVVAALSTWEHAWGADADHGEATAGPPRGHAAPRDGTKDTASEPLGRDAALTSQEKPQLACGGRPQYWQSTYPPLELPQRLGTGPSNAGRAELVEHGGRPASREYARRRDGDVDPGARASAACGGNDAAALSPREGPLEGSDRRRVQEARNESKHIERGTDAPLRSGRGSSDSTGVTVVGHIGWRGKRSRGGSTPAHEHGGGWEHSGACVKVPPEGAAGRGEQPPRRTGLTPMRRDGGPGEGGGHGTCEEEHSNGCMEEGRYHGGGSAAERLGGTAAGGGGSDQQGFWVVDDADGRGQPGRWSAELTVQCPLDKRRRLRNESLRGGDEDQRGVGSGATAVDTGSSTSHDVRRRHRGPFHAVGPGGSRGSRMVVPPSVDCDIVLDSCVSDLTNSSDDRAPAAQPSRLRVPRRVQRGGDTAAVDTGARRGHGGGDASVDISEDGAGALNLRGSPVRLDLRGTYVQPADTVGDKIIATMPTAPSSSSGGYVATRDASLAGLGPGPAPAKRRRLVGKQRPRGETLPTLDGASARGGGTLQCASLEAAVSDSGSMQSLVGTAGECSYGELHVRRGCDEFMLVHAGVSSGPSRSNTLIVHRAAATDRDGPELVRCQAGDLGDRSNSLAQRGAGLSERARGRGRPPEP